MLSRRAWNAADVPPMALQTASGVPPIECQPGARKGRVVADSDTTGLVEGDVDEADWLG